MSKTKPKVFVAGADWCGDTRRALRQLDELDVPYEYVNIEEDAEAEQWVKDQNDGKLKRPTIDIDGAILSQPSNEEIVEVLEEKDLLK